MPLQCRARDTTVRVSKGRARTGTSPFTQTRNTPIASPTPHTNYATPASATTKPQHTLHALRREAGSYIHHIQCHTPCTQCTRHETATKHRRASRTRLLDYPTPHNTPKRQRNGKKRQETARNGRNALPGVVARGNDARERRVTFRLRAGNVRAQGPRTRRHVACGCVRGPANPTRHWWFYAGPSPRKKREHRARLALLQHTNTSPRRPSGTERPQHAHTHTHTHTHTLTHTHTHNGQTRRLQCSPPPRRAAALKSSASTDASRDRATPATGPVRKPRGPTPSTHARLMCGIASTQKQAAVRQSILLDAGIRARGHCENRTRRTSKQT